MEMDSLDTVVKTEEKLCSGKHTFGGLGDMRYCSRIMSGRLIVCPYLDKDIIHPYHKPCMNVSNTPTSIKEITIKYYPYMATFGPL